jgi:hypothetical protein
VDLDLDLDLDLDHLVWNTLGLVALLSPDINYQPYPSSSENSPRMSQEM